MARALHELGVAVALHDLRGDRLDARPRSRQTSSSISGSTWAKLPTAPESLPTAMASRARRSRSRLRPASTYQTATLRPKVVGSACTPCVRADGQRVAVAQGQRRQRRAQALLPGDEQIGGVAELQRGGRVPDVVGGEADVHEARVGAELLLEAGEQRDHLVLDARLDREDARRCRPACRPDAGQRLGGDATAPRVGLAHRHLHPEPRLVLRLLAPDASHGGPGVPLDHAHTLMQNRTKVEAPRHYGRGRAPRSAPRTERHGFAGALERWGLGGSRSSLSSMPQFGGEVPAVERAERGQRQLVLVEELG